MSQERLEALKKFEIDEMQNGMRSTLGINGRFNGATSDGADIEGQCRVSRELIIETTIKESSQVRSAVARATRIAERSGLIGATSEIPEIVRVAQAQPVNVRADGESEKRPQEQFSENILIVHEIEEGSARIDARRGKNLEEGGVRVVIGITITGAAEVTST